MTLQELKYLQALAKYRHFGRAADATHVSQPSLSQAIKKLEQNLGLALVERAAQQVTLTDSGELVLAHAEKIFEEVQNIEHLSEAHKDQLATPLRIGAIYTIAPYLFPELIPALAAEAPSLPIEISENFTHVLRERLLAGDLDVIILALPFSEPSLLIQSLYKEPFSVVLHKNHSLAAKEQISAADLQDEKLLLLGQGHCLRDNILAACPNCMEQVGPKNTVSGTSLETLRHMVAAGMGITILPERAVQIDYYRDLLCVRPLAGENMDREVALVWRKSFPRPRAIGVLQRALQRVVEQHTN